MQAGRFQVMRLINNVEFRAWLYQILAIAGVIAIGWYLYSNASANLAKSNIATGFSYLGREAGFIISESLIDYDPSDSYAKALLVGILNTIHVSLIATFLATIIGVVVGVARLSSNPLLARLMMLYVEAIRNMPLLLLLFLIYAVIVSIFPPVREAFEILPNVFISNSGLIVPALTWEAGHRWMLLALVIGLIIAYQYRKIMLDRRVQTGDERRLWPMTLLLIVLPVLVAYLIHQPEFVFDLPEKNRFRLSGGSQLKPEFTALVVGLALSASTSIAEIVRSGIMAIKKGQSEAAFALGLHRGRVMRLVILPQALRVIIPPLTSVYLTVFKNSSLAIAIGYPDLVMVSNTTMNATGQAIEGIALFMLVYLTFSITISLLMNWYNGRVALKER